MEYVRGVDGFDPLPRRNVDFGGGLERLAMAAADYSDVFRLNVLWPIVGKVEALSGALQRRTVFDARDRRSRPRRCVLGRGWRGSVKIHAGVRDASVHPSRSLRQGLFLDIEDGLLAPLVGVVAETYVSHYPELEAQVSVIETVLGREEATFRRPRPWDVRVPTTGQEWAQRRRGLHSVRHFRFSARAVGRGGSQAGRRR